MIIVGFVVKWGSKEWKEGIILFFSKVVVNIEVFVLLLFSGIGWGGSF